MESSIALFLIFVEGCMARGQTSSYGRPRQRNLLFQFLSICGATYRKPANWHREHHRYEARYFSLPLDRPIHQWDQKPPRKWFLPKPPDKRPSALVPLLLPEWVLPFLSKFALYPLIGRRTICSSPMPRIPAARATQ